jgi:hypothetical protein
MFSIFANHSQNKPLENITLAELHRQLIQPDREPFASTVNLIQRLRSTNDPKTEKHVKGGLVCLTPAGTLSTKEANATAAHRNMKLSGFMQIDVDAQDNPNMKDAAAVRDKLSEIPYIALAAISARGRGVWGLLALEKPEQFNQYFEQVAEYFKGARVTIDKSKSKNPTELRYFAPDTGAILNTNYKLFPLVAIQKKVAPTAGKAATGASLSELTQWVSNTTGYTFNEGQKHNFIYWLSYAIRKNGATEAEVYNTIYNNVLSESLIHSNCIQGGVSHANNKGLYIPTAVQSITSSSRSRYCAKLPTSATNNLQYVSIAPAPNVRRDRVGTDSQIYNYFPELPELIDC